MAHIDGKYISNGYMNQYVKIKGDSAPTVIIEPAMGGLSVEWEEIQEKLSAHASVITYDRAGYAESNIGHKPRTAEQICDELFNLLNNAGIQPPYILVGNSMGGFYAQQFAKMFPSVTGGLVLVDSLTQYEPEFKELDIPVYQQIISMDSRINGIKYYLGLEPEEFEVNIKHMLSGLYEELPEELRNKMLVYHGDRKFYETIVDEWEAFPQSIDEFKRTDHIPYMPVKVLCRDYSVMVEMAKQFGVPEMEAKVAEEAWLRHSKSLLELSQDSEFIIVKNSSHAMHLTHPEFIVEAVIDVINKARNRPI